MRLTLRGGKGEDVSLKSIRQSILNEPLLSPEHGEGEALVWVNNSAVEAEAAKLNVSKVLVASKLGVNLPLIFDDIEQEVTFWGVTALLSLGSGWHKPLPHKYGPDGHPHRDSVTYGLVALFTSGHTFDADDCASLSEFQVSTAFNIAITKEERLDGGPIRQDVPSDFKPLLVMYTETLNKVGSELLARGFRSFGDFVLSTELQAHSRPTTPPPKEAFSASLLVSRLLQCFDCLRDEGYGGVIFHRRAQIVASELSLRFSHRDERFKWGDMSDLTMGADAESGVWLQEKGMVVVTGRLATTLEKGECVGGGSKAETMLRLACARALIALSLSLSAAHASAVTSAQVWKFVEHQSKIRHRASLKHYEATHKGEEAQPRISEITSDGPSPEETVEEYRQCLFICKDTPHY